MSVASLIARLVAAGTPADLVADVAMELARASAAQEIIETRRAKDRARKREAVPRNSTETVESAEFQTAPLILDKETSPRPPKEINPIPVGVTPARKGFPIPGGVTAHQWKAFCQQRKKKLNDHAYGLLTKKLLALARDGWPPGEMIDLAIERGWETVFKPTGAHNGQRTSNDRNEITNPITRAGIARETARRAGEDHERQGSSPLWS